MSTAPQQSFPPTADHVSVTEIMTRNVVCARPRLPVATLAQLMVRNHISCVPIVDERGHPKGMVTKSDLVELLDGEHATSSTQTAEDIMMPLVARLPAPKAPLFAHWCLSAGIAHGGFEHFVAHGVQSLAAHGSAKNTPAGATRVFVHALKTLCTPAQWAHYGPVARQAAPAPIWAAVIAEVPSLEIPAAIAA